MLQAPQSKLHIHSGGPQPGPHWFGQWNPSSFFTADKPEHFAQHL